MRVGSDGFEVVLMGEEGVGGSGKRAAQICRHGVNHIFLPEEAVAAAGSKVGHGQTGDSAQPLDLVPELGFCSGIEDVEAELAQLFQTSPGLELVEDGEHIELPHCGLGPKAIEG